jgi:hypothetical protein
MARRKGRSRLVWFLLGMFFGPISLLVLWAMRKLDSGARDAYWDQRVAAKAKPSLSKE